jgi:hypothetical protein
MYQNNTWWKLKNNGRQYGQHSREQWSLKNSEPRKRGHDEEKAGPQSTYSDRIGEMALRESQAGGSSWKIFAGHS